MVENPDERTLSYALAAPCMRGGYLIREARLRAGLSQTELARRVGTSQSLVARWEAEAVSPRFDTLLRAVRACELDLDLALRNYDPDRDVLIEDQLRIPPPERARRMIDFVESVTRLRDSARRASARRDG